jgi:outer membrane receptor protein involved in Fe transport
MCNSALALYSLQFLPPVVPFNDSSDDGKSTYMAQLMYKATDKVNVYGSVSTGFKASSWNLSVNSAPLAPATPDKSPLGGYANPYYGRYGSRLAGPETSTAYEIGIKGKWQTLALNAALFDQSIRGFQANIFQGTGFLFANAGNLNVKGIEFDANFKPTRNWEFSLAGSFLNPKFDSFVNGSCVDGPCDLSGSRPVGIHGVNVSSAVTYNWKMDDLAWFVRLDHRYSDDRQVVENVPASVASAHINWFNASIGMRAGSWDATLWCQNLTNDNFIASAFPAVAQPGSYSGYLSPPRMYGLTVRKSF